MTAILHMAIAIGIGIASAFVSVFVTVLPIFGFVVAVAGLFGNDAAVAAGFIGFYLLFPFAVVVSIGVGVVAMAGYTLLILLRQ